MKPRDACDLERYSHPKRQLRFGSCQIEAPAVRRQRGGRVSSLGG